MIFNYLEQLSVVNYNLLWTALRDFWLVLSDLGWTSDSSAGFLACAVRSWLDFGQLCGISGLCCPNLTGLRTALRDFWIVLSELGWTSDSSAGFLDCAVRTWLDFGQLCGISGLCCPILAGLRTALRDFWIVLSELGWTSDSSAGFLSHAVRIRTQFGQ
ncbi:hypothetical protein [Neobacillus cucumis]|uniref:hypothetical protein n=1 Tax=Neobacillus cucumis TaxID=1740721 RepID=UPI003670CEAF